MPGSIADVRPPRTWSVFRHLLHGGAHGIGQHNRPAREDDASAGRDSRALKTAEDALHVAAAGYIRVRWLADKPADKSDFEGTVRWLLEADQREARRG